MDVSLYKEHDAFSSLGTPLIIDFYLNLLCENDLAKIRIFYETSEKSDAIQWLNSNQTNLKQYPFMFTQCEAILARTLLPCQVKKI